MSNGFGRSIKVSQPKLREINLKILGTPGTPSAEGFDEHGISSVVDGTSGLLTIIFNRPFYRADVMVKSFMPVTADRRAEVVAVDYDRVTIQTTDLAGVDATADYYLSILGSDFPKAINF